MRVLQSLFCIILTGYVASGCKDEQPSSTLDSSPTISPTASPSASPTPEATPTPDSGVIVTPTAIPDVLEIVHIYPLAITIDATSQVPFSASGVMRFGDAVTVDVESWRSSDESIATIDATGVVSAKAVGTAEITAQVDGIVSSPAILTVIAVGTLNVQTIDAESREPLVGASIYRGLEPFTSVLTGESGRIQLTGEFAGAQTITAYLDGYYYATIQNAVSRNLVIPLRSVASLEEGKFSGDTDFSGMDDIGKKEIRVGIITRSFYGNPLALDTATIIGPYREVEVCTYPVDVPSNIVGETNCEGDDLAELRHYSVPASAGIYDSYMLAGILDYSTVLSWFDDPDIFYNLGALLAGIPNMYEFSYYHGEDIVVEAPAETTGVPAAPAGVTNAPMVLQVPPLPDGIDPSFLPVLFAMSETPDRGYLPVGINGAEGGETAVVYYPPKFNSDPLFGVILAGEAGVGQEGAYVAVMGKFESAETTIVTDDFMKLLQEDESATSLEERRFTFIPIPDASLYRSIFSIKFEVDDGDPDVKTYDYVYWDVYQPSTDMTTYLPNIPGVPALDVKVNWEFYGNDNGFATFEQFTAGNDQNVYDSVLLLERMSRNKIYDVYEALTDEE